MSNDELQRAIDDITSGGASTPVMPAPASNGVVDENEELVNEFGGVAPTKPAMSVAEQVAAELGETPTSAVPIVEPAGSSVSDEPSVPAEPVAPIEPVALGVDQAVENSINEPVVPEMPAAPDMSEEGSMMADSAAPETPEVSEVPEELKMEEPVTAGDVDLEEVKRNALRELYPLLKNMNINPEQAYDICKQVAEMGEKGAIAEALEAAKKISDDQTRANALLEIVEMIGK